MNPNIEAILGAAANAKHVVLNEGRIQEYVKVLAREELSVPDWRMPVYPEADDDTFVQFLGIGNALNYCFTDPKTKQKYETEYLGKRWRGAFGLWASLKRALDEGIPILNPHFLAGLEENEAKRIFEGSPPLPLSWQRLLCLRSAGQALYSRFGGSYGELFRRCGYRAFNGGKGIVEQLAKYDACYADATYFKPNKALLRFHKRANLFVMMYHGRALASNGALPLIEDAEDLTPPADYEVPKALRHLGILEYSQKLADAVDNGVEIRAHSRWEQEIRAQTVAAMRLLCDKTGKPISALDFRVWLDGKSSPRPHHLTATRAY